MIARHESKYRLTAGCGVAIASPTSQGTVKGGLRPKQCNVFARTNSCFVRNATALLCTLFAALAFPALARAHSIVVHSGTVQWESNRLCIQLDAEKHVLEHETKALGEQLSTTQMLERLARSIMVVGHESGPIPSSRVEAIASPTSIKTYYTISPSVSAVALIHQTDHRTLGPLARQIQLGLKQPDGTIARHLRLTSRGNHAVLLRGQPTIEPSGVDPFVEPVMRISDGPDGSTLQIDYPCRLLATWSEMTAFEANAISTAEFEHLRPFVHVWANSNISFLNHPSDSQHTPQLPSCEITIIDPTEKNIAQPNEHPVATVTSRIRCTVKLPKLENKDSATIKWTGFNSAVNRLALVRKTEKANELKGFLTPYQSTVTITRNTTSPVTICKPVE